MGVKREKDKIDVAANPSFGLRAKRTSGISKDKESEWALKPLDGNVPTKWIPSWSKPYVPAKVPGDDGGWTNSIRLSHAGNERHEVVVKGPDGGVVRDVVVTSVRHIPIRVYAKAGDAALAPWREALEAIQKAYDPAGIKFDASEASTNEDDAGVYAKGLDDEAELSEYAKKLFTSGELPAVPLATLRIFLVKSFEMRKDIVRAHESVTRGKLKSWNGLFQVLDEGQTLPDRAILEATAHSPFRKTDVNIKGRVRAQGHFLKFSLDDQWIDYYFPEQSADEGKITVKFEVLEPGFHAWSDARNVIVMTGHRRDGSVRTADELARIAIHEIGHSLSQVVKGKKDYSAGDGVWVQNGKYYDGHWGSGPHCWSHAKENRAGDQDPNGDYPFMREGAKKLCIMFNDALSSDVAPGFCDVCTLHLRLCDLSPFTGFRAYWLA